MSKISSFTCKIFLNVVICSFLIILPLHGRGAGIIPYMVGHSGIIWFLLGQDSHRHGVWLDFGGASDHGESWIGTAAREGHEETMGVFSGTHHNPLKKQKKGIKFFEQRIDSRFVAINVSKTFRMYFVDVTDKVKELGGKRKVIRQLKRTSRALHFKRGKGWAEYREKIGFKWIDFDTLFNSLHPKKHSRIRLYHSFRKTLGHATYGKKGTRPLQKLKRNVEKEIRRIRRRRLGWRSRYIKPRGGRNLRRHRYRR